MFWCKQFAPLSCAHAHRLESLVLHGVDVKGKSTLTIMKFMSLVLHGVAMLGNTTLLLS